MDEAEILHRFKEHEPKDAEVKMKLEAFEMEFASIALMIKPSTHFIRRVCNVG
jgi:hypothetical protein